MPHESTAHFHNGLCSLQNLHEKGGGMLLHGLSEAAEVAEEHNPKLLQEQKPYVTQSNLE